MIDFLHQKIFLFQKLILLFQSTLQFAVQLVDPTALIGLMNDAANAMHCVYLVEVPIA
ncbi:hypothetical protein D3C80_1715660 [compost metagenome]